MPALFKLSRFLVSSELLHLERKNFSGHVIYSTRSGGIFTVSASVWALLQAGLYADVAQPTRQSLIDAQILVPQDERELETVIKENRAAIDDNLVLYQVVQPSAWCQLDCSYCGQEHSRKYLSPEQQEAFLLRLRERLSAGVYRHLKIGWFGAEPLVGIGVIRRLSPLLKALAEEFGCTFSARIVTNGLALTPKIADELLTYGVTEAEVTLDGLAADHDLLRYTKNGKGSFDRIFANLRAVSQQSQMHLVLRCNVTSVNAPAVSGLIETLAANGMARSVSFYTSPVYDWGNDAHTLGLDRHEYAAFEMEWLALQIRLGFNVGLIPARRRIVCMSVQKDAEVVDAYGAVYNCTEAPYVPAYGSPNIYETIIPIANVRSGLAVGPNLPLKLSTFNDRILSGEQPICAGCAMLPVCGGQCPKSWHEGHEPCPSAKFNMPERLKVLLAMQQPQQ